jgi:hypothetical protein
MNVEKILTQNESKVLEFKESVDPIQKILATIVAFSNTSGGKIVLGIEDKTKIIKGIDNIQQAEEKLASSIYDSIEPQVVPNIETISFQGKDLLLIEVFPGNSRPYYLKSKGEVASTYVRVGSTNRIADSFMIESLRRTKNPKLFDELEAPGSSIKDIDLDLINETFSPERKIATKNLMTLGILADREHDSEKQYPATYGGVLLFSRNKDRFLPDAWIQAGSFQGETRTHIIDSQEIQAPFVRALPEAMMFIRKHLNVSIRINDLQHKEEWSLPQVAVRESLVNALLHCDYSLGGSPIRIALYNDRLEIENPGLLPFGMTFDNFYSGVSKIRNRVIARVFLELKLIERWGSGVHRIIEACEAAGLQKPTFEEIGTSFRVTLFKKKIHEEKLSSTEQKIRDLLAHSSGLSTKQIADSIGMSSRQVRVSLIGLLNKGVVSEIKRHDFDPEKKYFLK